MNILIEGAVFYAAKRVLGKTLDLVSEDIGKVYVTGRDKIFSKAERKIENKNDDYQANLRTTVDILLNGSFIDEEICAEYFGGILASGRTLDGKDDSGIYYLSIIKSMSSSQLMLHYIIYRLLNKKLLQDGNANQVGQAEFLNKFHMYFPQGQLMLYGIEEKKVAIDVIVLGSHGLIASNYKTSVHSIPLQNGGRMAISYVEVVPTTLGIQLYAIAHNRLKEWSLYGLKDFGEFPDISTPEKCAFSLDELVPKN